MTPEHNEYVLSSPTIPVGSLSSNTRRRGRASGHAHLSAIDFLLEQTIINEDRQRACARLEPRLPRLRPPPSGRCHVEKSQAPAETPRADRGSSRPRGSHEYNDLPMASASPNFTHGF